MADHDPPASLLQPNLSRVLTHLQPGLEFVCGTDPANLRLVHMDLAQAAPLLILGDPAMGTLDLARALLVQAYALNDSEHLRVSVADCSGHLAPLVQSLPHPQTFAAATDEWETRIALQGTDWPPLRGKETRRSGLAWIIIVNDYLDISRDSEAWRMLKLLLEHGRDKGLSLIAITHAGLPEVNALFRTRIAFASSRDADSAQSCFPHKTLLDRLNAERQPGQFLVAGPDASEGSLLIAPHIDIIGLRSDEEGRITTDLGDVPLIPCAVLVSLLQQANAAEPVGLARQIAAHVRSCPRCRHGIVTGARAFPVEATITCAQCMAGFPAYYEATHPDYILAEMATDQLIQVALHLGQCSACGERWAALLQISLLEEEGV